MTTVAEIWSSLCFLDVDTYFKALKMLHAPAHRGSQGRPKSVPKGSDLNKRWSVTEKRGNHPSVLSSACDQLAELKEKKDHVSFLQVDSAALRHLQQMDGPLLKGLTFQLSTAQPSINAVTVKSCCWTTWTLRIQQNSSSHSDSPTSSECLSGSLSTKLLSECLSERRELIEARL